MAKKSALDILKDGIYNKDWELVINGFQLLTGIELYHATSSPPKRNPRKPKAQPSIKPKINEVNPHTENGPTEDSDKKFTKRLPFKKPNKNKFIDDGTIATKDKLIDKKLFRGIITPRSRKPPLVKINCWACNKQYKVDSSLIHDRRYKCDRCISSTQ